MVIIKLHSVLIAKVTVWLIMQLGFFFLLDNFPAFIKNILYDNLVKV